MPMSSRTSDPQPFDEYYKQARGRLLLQTYALTGDLEASRHAVKDAFVAAWHHWGKLRQLDDPESVVRPTAWRHAQRRHTARPWHREKDLDPEVRETLAALEALSTRQRKALVLTQVAGVPIPVMAREVGLPLDDAERVLQSAVAEFTERRGVGTLGIRGAFDPMERALAEARFPRPSIVRRAGTRRRRSHALVGAVAAVVVLLVSGAFVADATGVRPSLHRASVPASSPGEDGLGEAPEDPLPEEGLLDATQLADALGTRGWRVRETHDNPDGGRMLMPCQQQLFADPAGLDTSFREFRARGRGPARAAVQMAEASANRKAARRGYRTAAKWFAGCTDSRVQLIATRSVEGIGDQAVQMVLRSWEKPVTTMVASLARTGSYTTATVHTQADEAKPDVDAMARSLGAAVDGLCELPLGGTCTEGRPRLAFVPPLPAGMARAMLSVVDLPPVSKVSEPWVATDPKRARTNLAATRCDDTAFSGRFQGAPVRNNFTRSFVVVDAGLPAEFGITQTVGALPRKQARALVEKVRADLTSCPRRDLGTEVERATRLEKGGRSLTVWHLTTELSDDRSFRYSMAIMRHGTAVSQLGFVQAPGVGMDDGAFASLAERALDRLAELPPPK